MALPERRLGASDLRITPVGFGAWAIGGGDWAYGWGRQDDESSIRAIHRAVELGVNWIDTAAIYGLGHSEEVVGEALRRLPGGDRPYVFTKCGMVPDRSRPMDEPVRSLEPASIRRECDDSLRRLGTERIDLYQFHWPDAIGTPVEDSWGEMLRLVDEGKVRVPGVCNFDIELLRRCESVGHVGSLQPPFSMIRRGAAADVIPWALSADTGVICYSPMQSGILTDSFTRERVDRMDEGDWRRRNDQFRSPRLDANLALRDALRPIAERHGTTVAAIAIAWVTAWPGVTGAIVGARSPEQVEGWIGAAALQLTPEDLDLIAGAIRKTGAGSGPDRPSLGEHA